MTTRPGNDSAARPCIGGSAAPLRLAMALAACTLWPSLAQAQIPVGTRVIVQGQDFVREGQRVDAVPASAATAQR